MTDTNSTLLSVAPFVRHRAYTLWRWEPHPTKPGERIKVPVHYDGHTRHSMPKPATATEPARAGNPAPPLTADEARGWLDYHRSQGDADIGVGFRPDKTGLVCIDLDDCVHGDQWTPGALAIMARFPGALYEQSVSGRGLHIWVTAPNADVGRRGQVLTPHGKVEMYANGQYLAAGTVLAGDASIDHTVAVTAMLAEFFPPIVSAPAEGSPEWSERTPEEQAAILADLRSALRALDPDNRDEWVGVGQALRELGDLGYAMWAEWSATSTRFPGGDGLDKWDSFTGERTGYQAVLARAQRAGWVNPASRPALPGDAAAVFQAAPSAAPPQMLLEPPASRLAPVPKADGALAFMAAAGGVLQASLAKVTQVLLTPEAGVALRYDTFKDDQFISIGGAPWRAVTDADVIDLRIRFEQQGFKPVSAECMNDAIKAVCAVHRVDSAQEWAAALQWDGVPRIDRLLPDYYGTEDTPYARAVGAYLFTALAGRSLVPGVKADMAVILVGVQGGGKTTSVEVLSPDLANFGEVDLSKKDADLARSLRGKQVMELAELQGLTGRALEATKAWVSRKHERWVPKFEEREITYPRRMVVVGTTNEDEFLDDPTGERRWLPVRCGEIRFDAIRADCVQLWAEGAARFKANGVEWQAAKELAAPQHAQYKVHDDWRERIEHWLDSVPPPAMGQPLPTQKRCEGPLILADVLTGALGMLVAHIDVRASKRGSKIMRALGYRTKTVWIDGHAVRRWVPLG